MRELTKVFTSGPREMAHAHIARLAVLYEDLRIELTAITQQSLPVLDITDERYRANYFLRRCIATLVEFAETIRLLEGCAEFQEIRGGYTEELLHYWVDGVRFFRRYEPFLRSVRNDIGGHFGSQAAVFSIRNLDAGAVGKIEARTERTLHLHFAGELVATATLRHLRGATNEEKFSRLLRVVVTGFRRATECAHFVTIGYLWDRFGI